MNSAVQAPRSRRLPLIAGLILFVSCGLCSCLMITLASQGEIVIPMGSAPDQVARVWLVMDARQRGIGVSSARVTSSSENALCVQTNVSYVLWQGSGDAVVYCECYTRLDDSPPWEWVEAITGECAAS